MKKFNLIIVVISILLVSCNRPNRKPIKIEVSKFVITGIYQPKHFRVDLKRLSDGRRFINIYVSKHCNNWEDNYSIGDTITLKRYTYTDGESDVIEFDKNEMYNCLCQ